MNVKDFHIWYGGPGGWWPTHPSWEDIPATCHGLCFATEAAAWEAISQLRKTDEDWANCEYQVRPSPDCPCQFWLRAFSW